MSKLETRIRAFWRRVTRGAPDECWEWVGSKVPNGRGIPYGQTTWKGRLIPVTHFAYFIYTGEWPKYQINHRCHNTLCVNSNHIYDGTQKQNMADMLEAGRENRPSQKGASNAHAKLTDKKVREIRKLYATGSHTMKQLGKKYNVSSGNIHCVVRRKTWKHVK